jgi:hypothetical protein
VGGVGAASERARDKHEKEQFDVTSSRCQYPTVPATSRHGISARFNGDIRYVLIDVSLFRRCIATSGRGCRPQRVNFLQNKLTRGHNALASASSASSPNAPITPLFARSHLIQYGQHPKWYDETESCGSAADFLLGTAINASKDDQMEGGLEGEIGTELDLKEEGVGVDLFEFMLDNNKSKR